MPGGHVHATDPIMVAIAAHIAMHAMLLLLLVSVVLIGLAFLTTSPQPRVIQRHRLQRI